MSNIHLTCLEESYQELQNLKKTIKLMIMVYCTYYLILMILITFKKFYDKNKNYRLVQSKDHFSSLKVSYFGFWVFLSIFWKKMSFFDFLPMFLTTIFDLRKGLSFTFEKVSTNGQRHSIQTGRLTRKSIQKLIFRENLMLELLSTIIYYIILYFGNISFNLQFFIIFPT